MATDELRVDEKKLEYAAAALGYCSLCGKANASCSCMKNIDHRLVFEKIMAMRDAVEFLQQKKLLRQAEELFILVSKSIERR